MKSYMQCTINFFSIIVVFVVVIVVMAVIVDNVMSLWCGM